MVSLGSLGALFLFYQVRHRLDVLDAFAGLDPRALPAALLLHVIAHLVWGGRLALVSRSVGAPMGTGAGLRLVTAGVFGASITPGRIGGDGLRFLLLRRRGWSAAPATKVLLADRFLDLLFFLLVGLAAVPLLPVLIGGDTPIRVLVLIGVSALAALVLLLVLLLAFPAAVGRAATPFLRLLARILPRATPRLRGAMGRMLRQSREGMLVLARDRRALPLAFVLTVLTWLAELGILWVLLRGFGHDVPLVLVLLLAALLNILTSLPLTPGGSGVAEVGAMALFSPLAVGLTPAFVLVWRGLTFYYDLVVGGIVAARGSARLPSGP